MVLPRLALIPVLLPIPPASWDDRCTPPYPVYWDGVLLTFCLGWLQIVTLLISTSWEAKIIGESHNFQPENVSSPMLSVPISGDTFSSFNQAHCSESVSFPFVTGHPECSLFPFSPLVVTAWSSTQPIAMYTYILSPPQPLPFSRLLQWLPNWCFCL
jgi:hypothetical protein